MIYLFVFTISCMLFYVGARKKKTGLERLCYAGALILPALLAALRADNIGSDVLTYVKPFYLHAKQAESFQSFFQFANTEWLYALFTYVVCRMGGSLAILHFLTQLFISYMVFASVRETQEGRNIWLAMMVYYLMFYNQTYNIVRQSMACACVLYSLVQLNKKRYARTVVFFLLAVGFHGSAYVSIMFYLLFWLNSYMKKTLQVAIIVGGLIFIAFSREIFLFLVTKFTFIPQKYLNVLYRQYEIDMQYWTILLFALSLILLIMLCHKCGNSWYEYLFKVQLLTLVLFPLSAYIGAASRIFMYSQYICILVFPNVQKVIKIKLAGKMSETYAKLLITMFLFIYWGYMYVYAGSCETYPYQFVFV